MRSHGLAADESVAGATGRTAGLSRDRGAGEMTLRPLAHGLATFVPGTKSLRAEPTGGTDSARYCYTVWLRHAVMAKRNGLDPHPTVVAEFGPGDSLGIGLAAMISGCETYFAFDAVQHACTERNLRIYDDLVGLFRERAPLPGDDEYLSVKPRLECYDFPSGVYSDDHLCRTLDDSRIENIRSAICDPGRADSPISYKAPWYDSAILREGVCRHDLLPGGPGACRGSRGNLCGDACVAETGRPPVARHRLQVSRRCRRVERPWAYSDVMWTLIKGRRPYLVNRQPHSVHIRIMQDLGFEVVCDETSRSESTLSCSDLAPRFATMSDDDLVTSDAFIQCVKQGCTGH